MARKLEKCPICNTRTAIRMIPGLGRTCDSEPCTSKAMEVIAEQDREHNRERPIINAGLNGSIGMPPNRNDIFRG